MERTFTVSTDLPKTLMPWLLSAVKGMEGRRVCVSIQQVDKPRSGQQNRFYQGPFIGSLRQHILDSGHRVSADDIHAGLRDAHAKNGYSIILPDKKEFVIPPSTVLSET